MNSTSGSILPIALLLAALVFGIVTHRRWLWIAAGSICVALVVVFLMFGLGHGYGGGGGQLIPSQ
jgi:hypothetical protein